MNISTTHWEVYKNLNFTTSSSASQLAHQSLILNSYKFVSAYLILSQLLSISLYLKLSLYLSFRSSWLTMRPHDPWSVRPTERRLQVQVTIRDHYDRPKGGFKFRSSWFTMRLHDPWSLLPTKRWLQLQVLMAHHETSQSVIITADRNVASASGPHGSPWDLTICDITTDQKVASASGPHSSLWDLTIRDHDDRPKGSFKSGSSLLTMRPLDFRSSWLTFNTHGPWGVLLQFFTIQIKGFVTSHSKNETHANEEKTRVNPPLSLVFGWQARQI